jgi:ATP-dependent DNA helicase RecG
MNIKESERLETKKSVAQLKDSLKSISAILNKHQKGILYFGIGPDGKPVKNIFSEKTLRDISQAISSSIEPKIYPSITTVKYKNVDVIKIYFEGIQIPYSAEGRYYIRVADEDKQMSAEELKKIIINNKDQRWDSTFHPSASLKDIDSQKVKAFCKITSIKFSNIPDILETLNLYKNNRLLNSAIILFAKNPINFFANSFLTCAVFASGTTSTIIDQKKFEGDLFFLIEEAEKYILQNIHIGMTLDGLYRNDVPELNREALREAIINAFLHRNYYDPDFVSVSIFKDRVEIKNPGNLFGGLTIIDITSRNISKRRNEVIADIFNRAHLGERKGRGIALILEKEPDTKFEQLAGIFITTFKRMADLIPQKHGGLSGGIKKVYEYIKNNPGHNTKEISIAVSEPFKTVEKWIIKLRRNDLIEFKGSKKTGGYFLKII